MYQKHMIIGRLGKAPDLRYTPSQQPVCSFPIAAERLYVDSKNQQVKEVTWYSIKTWGTLAESCEKHLTKGQVVMIEGRLGVDPKTGGPKIWFDESGKAHANFEITANIVKFLTPTNTLGADPVYVTAPDAEFGLPNEN